MTGEAGGTDRPCDAGAVDKFGVVTFVQKRLFNPLVRPLLEHVPIPETATKVAQREEFQLTILDLTSDR